MPDKRTIERARKDKREGKSVSTQAGEFVREEIDIIRKGFHGARSAKQAIAIGLSKARRAGVKLKPPAKGKVSEKTRKSAKSAYEKGQKKTPISKTRSKARLKALEKEPRSSVSHLALSRQAKQAAKKRTAAERSASAKKAVRTKGPKELSEAAKKAAMTRALTSKNGNGNEPPVKPEKNNPAKPDTNPDPTKRRPGVNEPEKIDPTRIEPEKTEPTPPETPPSK